MKHTVVSGIFGFTTAVIAVFYVGFLRERVPLALEDHLDASLIHLVPCRGPSLRGALRLYNGVTHPLEMNNGRTHDRAEAGFPTSSGNLCLGESEL